MHKQSKLKWRIYKNDDGSFPFWLFIEQESGKFLFLKAREKWPGPGKNIFCKFEGIVSSKKLPKTESADECEIVSVRRWGRRVVVVLNRARNKRCWFIFVQKEYKKHPGTFYTQVFWITQSSSKAQRRGAYIPRTKVEGYTILIDSRERYAYSFGNVKTEKTHLRVGDYALQYNGKILAIVERKTKDNILHELSHLDVLRANLQELNQHQHKAAVFESSYADFVSPKNKFYTGAFVARILADLSAQFPHIQFVFFKGRKSANQWVYYYFAQIFARNKIEQA